MEDISIEEGECPESTKGCLTLDLGKLYTSSRAVLGNLVKEVCFSWDIDVLKNDGEEFLNL